MAEELPFDKENIARNMLFPREKLGSVPEHSALNGGEKSFNSTIEKKLADLELEMPIDGGQKHIAFIDPFQHMNRRSLIANKLLVSPLQMITNKKRSHSVVEFKGNEGKTNKKAKSKSQATDLDEALCREIFSGKSKETMTNVDIEEALAKFVRTINLVERFDETKVFDTCSEVASKVNIHYYITF